MIRQVIRVLGSIWAAAMALVCPAGTAEITKSADTIEATSTISIDRWDVDPRVRFEQPREHYIVEVPELEGGSRSAELPDLSWFQPLSEPRFDRGRALHASLLTSTV